MPLAETELAVFNNFYFLTHTILGQCREFHKNIPEDGSRADWGPVFLHARPVSTSKQQQAASGISDAPTVPATAGANTTTSGVVVGRGVGGTSGGGTAFTSDHLHRGGFQALELIRITNLTPLLWVRVDPHGLYNGRINIFQQDGTRIIWDKNTIGLCTLFNSLWFLLFLQHAWRNNYFMMEMPQDKWKQCEPWRRDL